MRKRPLSFMCLIFLIIQGMIIIIRGGLSFAEMPASSIFQKPEGQEVDVTGMVYNKKTTSNTQILFLKNNSISIQENFMIYDSDFNRISIGETIQIKGTISHFDRAHNPGNFDQMLYYAKDHVYGAIFCEEILQSDGGGSKIKEGLYQLKIAWKETLIENMGEEQGNVLAAMLLGEKAEMDADIKELYQKNGIGHVLAISGLHISFIGLGIYQLLRKIKMPFGLAGILAIGILSLYACMIGMTVSVFRAFIMLLFKIGADITGRVYDMLTALMVSAAISVWRQPLYLLDAGFYLSYGAVLGLLIFSPYLTNSFLGKRKWTTLLIPGLCINIALFPIQLWFYYEFPTYSLFLNLLIVPLMSVILTFGIIGSGVGLISPIGGQICLHICKWILMLYKEISEVIIDFPFSRMVTGRPETGELIIYYVVIGVVLFQIVKKKSMVILSCLLSVFLLINTPTQGLQVTMLDVGQGDGLFIRGPKGSTYLVDGGSSNVEEVGKYRLEPYLKYSGVRIVDYVFVSHGDGDHYSGIMEMLSRQAVGVRIRNLVLPENYKNDSNLLRLAMTAKRNDTKVMVMKEGAIVQEDDLKIVCLQPREESNVQVIVPRIVPPSVRGSMTIQIPPSYHRRLVPLHLRRRCMEQARCAITKLSLYSPYQHP